MLNFKKNKLADRRKVIATGYTMTLGSHKNLTLLVAAVSSSFGMHYRQCHVHDIIMMTKHDRRPCTKLPPMQQNSQAFSSPLLPNI